MPITVAEMTSNSSTTNTNTYNTASITTVAGRLYTCAWVNTRGSADPDLPTITSTGMTWENIASIIYVGAVTVRPRISLFRTMGTGGTGVVNGAWTNNGTGAAWSILEWDGVDTSGSNGSGAIVQFDDQTAAGTTTCTTTLANPLTAGSAHYAAFSTNAGTTFTAEGTWTELPATEVTYATPAITLGAMYQLLSSDTTALGTVGASGEIGGIAIEIKAAPAAAGSLIWTPDATPSTVYLRR